MKLLLVDDSNLNLIHAEGLLKRSGLNLDITTRRSGEQALEYLSEHSVDIILMDIVMPGMSGIDALRIIRERSGLRGSDVLMFSSLLDKEVLHECFELGASDYIAKPIDELEFLARIKSAVRKRTLENAGIQYLKAIEDQNRELTELNQQLKDAQYNLIQQEKMASVGHLAAGIAHEINNPLGFITSNFSTLRKYIDKYQVMLEMATAMADAKDSSHSGEREVVCRTMEDYIRKNDFQYIRSDIEELFQDTQEGLDRVGRIVRGLRNFSRIDQLEEMGPYDINEGVENTLIISRNALKYSAAVELNLGEVHEILAFGGSVNQVILNILLNGIDAVRQKHGDRMGRITIRSWEEPEAVCLAIADDGIGIPEEHLKNIFNPFYTTKPVGEGTGLGLSISYDIIVAKHGGWIDVVSTPGEGTEFVIRLPKRGIFGEEPQ